jgi:FAD/FMN-containing dehydrogenase
VNGQAQSDGGIVCDLSALDQVGEIGADRVTVGAGARWSTVLTATTAAGLSPPVLTDYLELTVGGTLSAGGIGGASHLHGPQCDHVLEADVIDTATGDLVTCSPRRSPDRFFAAIAGNGRGGIITQATLPLIPAPQRARLYTVPYPGPGRLIAGQLAVARERRFGYLEGQIAAADGPGWACFLQAAYFYSGAQPDDAALLGVLGCDAHVAEAEDVSYLEFCHRLDAGLRERIAAGDWYSPHPWLSVFLPAAAAGPYVSGALTSLTPAQVGPIPMLLYPLRRGTVPARGLRTPDSGGDGLFYSFSILRTVPDDPLTIAAALDHNQQLAREARDAGGTVYPGVSAAG